MTETQKTKEHLRLASRKDILELEAQEMPALPRNTYEAIAQSADKYPDRIALKFFLQKQIQTDF